MRSARTSPPEDGLLLQQALSIFDAAMDQCEDDGDDRTRQVIDRLAVDVLACIRGRVMPVPTPRPRLVSTEARS